MHIKSGKEIKNTQLLMQQIVDMTQLSKEKGLKRQQRWQIG